MTFLKDNVDVFAWEHADMEGIDHKVACHRLNTSTDVKLKQQRRRLLNPKRDIEANLEKIRALQEMRSPTKIKEVQSIIGRIAALSRFVSKSTDKCKPFFDDLHSGNEFKRNEAFQLAFEGLKVQLAQPPLLPKLMTEERLILYLAVSKHSISSC
ncbi:Uncharacterized protein Adt_20625 [Abeliophyllum distichum]|uniref:Uncharacterized protein n=1 Tax=Abeliophyllum distichum TaxID=126358 RepID=A0ABD1SX58_9LAMI